MTQLTHMLHECNPYVQTFPCMREWAQFAHNNTPAAYQMFVHADCRPSHEHVRRHNGPEASEVAALIPGNEDGEIGRRDIVVRRRGTLNSNENEVLDPISVSHRTYDPLSYVLLFPNGSDGWYLELRFSSADHGRRTKITLMMHYGWHLFERAGEFSTILHAA